jgi:hypothetical protein
VIYLLGYPRHLSYDLDWIQAFCDHYGDTCLVHLGRPPQTDLKNAQLVVLLHSCTAQGVKIPQWVYDARARNRKGTWLMLSGNDYKHFADKQRAAEELQIDLLGTLAPDTPYMPRNGIAQVAHVPHALNEKAFHPRLPYKERAIRVGYRGYRYPDILGDTLRNDMVERFMATRDNDVRWAVFERPQDYAEWLSHCKATPATEAGAMGMKAISSRQFDAIGSGTALIMTPGAYSGCLTEKHYIRLEPDFSNIDEALERVDDEEEWQSVTTRALEHVRAHHTYPQRMRQLDKLLWH